MNSQDIWTIMSGMGRIRLAACAFCLVCLTFAAPAKAADAGTATWEDAKKACAAMNRNVLTMKGLQDLAAGKGHSPAAAQALSEGIYWSSDESVEKGQYLVVYLPDGKPGHFPGTDKHRFICDQGPRRSAARTWDEADAICSSQGKKLPTVEYLQSIAGETGDGSYTGKGLTMGNYWTREPGEKGHEVVLTGNGKNHWFNDTDKYSVHCTE